MKEFTKEYQEQLLNEANLWKVGEMDTVLSHVSKIKIEIKKVNNCNFGVNVYTSANPVPFTAFFSSMEKVIEFVNKR